MSRYLLNRVGSCRLFPSSQSVISPAVRVQARTFANQANHSRIPVQKGVVIPSLRLFRFLQASVRVILADGVTTQSFLTAIGRGAVEKVKVTEWTEFWLLDGSALKAAGLTVRDRRYILWCMEKYRQGLNPATFAHPPTPKKKIRGHGPAVQNGKRIRSRRKQ